MKNSGSNKTSSFVVVGGGFTGLSMAYCLLKNSPNSRIRIYESQKDVGGLMGQGIQHLEASFFSESAANGFLLSPRLENVAQDLGIELLKADPKSSKSRFFFSQGRMRRWPLGIFATIRMAIGLLVAFVFKNLKPQKGISIREWGEKIFGREFVRGILEPGLGGIYASPADNLSASLIIGSLLKRRKKNKSQKTSRKIVTAAPLEGMRSWCEGLKQFLVNSGRVDFVFESKFEGRTWVEERKRGVDRIFLALSLNKTLEFLESLRGQANAQLIAQSIAQSQSLNVFFENLKKDPLSMQKIASVTLQFNEPPLGLQKKYQGFGCLFPRTENFNSLGVLFNSCIFPKRYKKRNETFIFGKTQSFSTDFEIQSKGIGESLKRRLVEAALEDRKRIFNIAGIQAQGPDKFAVYVWPEALPCYDMSLEKFLGTGSFENLEVEWGFEILGNFRGHLSLSKIFDDCWETAQKVGRLCWEN